MSRLKTFVTIVVVGVMAISTRPAVAQEQPPQEQAAPTIAPATLPTDAPTTAPVIILVAVDATSPRGALKLFIKSMGDGDTATAERILVSDNDVEKNWAAVMLRFSAVQARVYGASVNTFGEEGAKVVVGDVALAQTYALASIDKSTEELQGDKATIRSDDGAEGPIEVRRVEGSWRVPVKVFVGDAPAEKLDETAAKMSRQADAIEAFCLELTAGKYKTPEDAAQALQLTQVKAVFGEQAPATAPASTPTTQQAPG